MDNLNNLIEDNDENKSISPISIILTTKGPRKITDLMCFSFKSLLKQKQYKSKEGSSITGFKSLFRITTEEGFFVDLTKNNNILVKKGSVEFWKKVSDLKQGDFLVLNKTRNVLNWKGIGNFEEGWLLGYLLNSGSLHPLSKTGKLIFKGKDRERMRRIAFDMILKSQYKNYYQQICLVDNEENYYLSSKFLWNLCVKYTTHFSTQKFFNICSSTNTSFQKGFITGIADSSAYVDTQAKIIEIVMKSEEISNITQMMLLHLGINTINYPDRRQEYKLIIVLDNVFYFKSHITCLNPSLYIDMESIYNTDLIDDMFIATFKDLCFLKNDFVLSCNMGDNNPYNVNGFILKS